MGKKRKDKAERTSDDQTQGGKDVMQTVLYNLSQLIEVIQFSVEEWIKDLQGLQSDSAEGGDLIN